MTFSEAKKTKMEKLPLKGAELAIEIGKKVNEDFDKKKYLNARYDNAIIQDKN